MPIKPHQRSVIDGFVNNLLQSLDGEDIDAKLNYAISRLVASSYAKNGKWEYSSIQRAVGLFARVAHEFDRRVADVHEDEEIERYGDIGEYAVADIEDEYRKLARYVVRQFQANGTFKRVDFDILIRGTAMWENDEDMFAFTNRLHADGYIVMHPVTVTLGLVGLELRKCQAQILTARRS